MTTHDKNRLSAGSTDARRTSWRGRGSGLLLLGALAALALGCSGGGDGLATDSADAAGTIGMSLRLSDGVGIDAVSYTISGGPTALSGTIDVSQSATISATLGPLAVGGGYTLRMTATTSAGSRCTGSAGPFAVAANQATPVSIVLTCPSVHTTGTVAVDVTTSACPRIAALTAAPSEVYVGHDVQLVAVAGPDDTAHGYPLTYAWSGVSSSDGAGNALFHCASAGTFTVGLVVDNGNAACVTSPPDPAMTSSITVTCTDDGSGT